MATPTYTPLATLTLTAADSSIVFSSSPATYRDLIVVSDVTSSSGGNFQIRLNNDSGANYNTVLMRGVPNTHQSFAFSNETVGYLSVSTIGTNRTNAIVEIMDYSATDKQTMMLSRCNHSGGTVVERTAIRWANSSAVNTVNVYLSAGTFSTGSKFSLYGIAG